MKAIAFSNNDIGLVVWKYNKKIPKCLGFCISRIDLQSRVEEALPAWVGFKKLNPSEVSKPKTTREWPVQKFNWRDFTAKRGGFYQYKVIPMIGTEDNLKPHSDPLYTLLTNPVNLSSRCGDISVFFNRGIIATQSVARSLSKSSSGRPNYRELVDRIDQPGDPLRNRLAANMRDALFDLLDRAKTQSGHCYGALYEFSDTELESKVLGAPYVHLILSNTGPDDKVNRSTRQALHESRVDVTDRMLGGGHIGHNKFMVYVDSTNKPKAVLTGSTNWTPSGICGQTNNALIIESEEIASIYYKYWNLLKSDNSQQTIEFRQHNNTSNKIKIDKGNTNVTVWFSPNTKQKNKPKKPAVPSDMAEVFDIINNAKQAVLFLAFKPGKPNFIDVARQVQRNNSKIFVRGALTDEELTKTKESEVVDLFHYSAQKPDSTILSPAAIDDEFSYWQKELLKTSPTAHAIVHDKIIVVDPFSDNCTAITGSHNLGLRASYANDENLLIIQNNRAICEAYATHIMDVYDHYRWRRKVKEEKEKAWSSLEENDSWQDKYHKPNGPENTAVDFWMSAER